MAYYKPMTYLTRCYSGESTVYGKYAVYFCNKDGERIVQTFDTIGQFKAFVNALKGIGYKKHRDY